MLNLELFINKTILFVKNSLEKNDAGHDWWHVERVWQMARRIAEDEVSRGVNVDMLVVELGALLHDVGDAKFHGGDDKVGEKQVGDFLATLTIDSSIKEHVLNIVKHISFRHSLDKKPNRFSSSELSIVQDADRLDAMGAIGIARAFSYGGFSGRPLHDHNYLVKTQLSKHEYQTAKSPTIAHFYEKLLTLKDKMNTELGKQIAQDRHQFMEEYLQRFLSEWSGE